MNSSQLPLPLQLLLLQRPSGAGACCSSPAAATAAAASAAVVAHAPLGGGTGKKRSPAKALFAGGVSGAIEAVVSYPTEFVKTNLQLFSDKTRLGPIGVAREAVARDGVRGLYRGLSSLLFFSVPKVSTRMWGFETAKSALADEKGKMGDARTLLCGLFAGASEAVVAVTPMDTIKTRLIHDQLVHAPAERKYKGFFHGVATIVREQGLAGTYKGLTATVLKQSTNQAIRWLTFSRAKEAMAARWFEGDTARLHAGHTVLASVLAGTASVYGNTPIDVVKTRMQGLDAARYKGTLDCAAQILRHEGPRAFYKGATARLVRVCLDVTVIMVLYEAINEQLDAVWPDQVK
jgi:solute carrier family 25 citrate transporter 1